MTRTCSRCSCSRGWPAGRRSNHPATTAELPVTSELSDRLSRDLKKRGFTFVGSTIMNAYLEAVGVFDDHVVGCPAKTPEA